MIINPPFLTILFNLATAVSKSPNTSPQAPNTFTASIPLTLQPTDLASLTDTTPFPQPKSKTLILLLPICFLTILIITSGDEPISHKSCNK